MVIHNWLGPLLVYHRVVAIGWASGSLPPHSFINNLQSSEPAVQIIQVGSLQLAIYIPGVPRPIIAPLCSGLSKQRWAAVKGRRRAAIIANFIAASD